MLTWQLTLIILSIIWAFTLMVVTGMRNQGKPKDK